MFIKEYLNNISELRRLQPILRENDRIQEEPAQLRDYLSPLLAEFAVFEDKLKGIMPRVRRLQGELATHKRCLKACIPPKLEKAIKNL